MKTVRLSAACAVLVMLGLFSGPAFAQIAPGVQQSAAQTANITGTVSLSDGTFVGGAYVKLIGPAVLSATSDAHGVFQFTSVPRGTYTIVASAANLGTATRSNVAVNSDINVQIQFSPSSTGLKTIANVTTRSAGASINVTPASIASITPSAYAFAGNSSWKEFLNQVPGVTVGGYLGGGQYVTNAIPDGPFQPISLSVNGALPYETSITLDGMPLVNTSYNAAAGLGVDMAFLPMPAFDTADVVRGPGANAPSIVDSIGGSFVLHAPGSVDSNHFEVSASNDSYGGIVANSKAALHMGRLSVTAVYGVNDSPGPLGTQNEIPAFAFTPTAVDGQPFVSCTTPASCSTYVTSPSYQGGYYALNNSLLYCCVAFNTNWTQHNGALGLSYSIGPSVSAQVFYAGSSSAMQEPFQGYPVHFTPASGYTGSIAPGWHDYISAQVSHLTQSESLLEERLTAYLGRGVVRLAALQNTSFGEELIPGPGAEPSGGYTVWGTGYYATSPPGMPVIFNGSVHDLTFGEYVFDYASHVNNRDLLATYDTQIGSTSNVGISYAKSYYNAPYALGGVCCGGFHFGSSLASAASEATTEVRIRAGAELTNRLFLDASWYFASGSYHVPDPANVGAWTDSNLSYSAPRFGLVWRPSADIAIRAAAGGGYAIPPVGYLTGSSTPFCFGGVCTASGPNLHLTPEKSFGFDIGSDVRLHRDVALSVDLYRANLYGQFFQSTTTGSYFGQPLYTTQYGNLAQSRYEGVTFDAHNTTSRGVYWHVAAGLTRAYVVSVPPGFYDGTTGFPATACTNCQNTYIIPGINYDGQYQSTVPYANGTAEIGYRWSPGKYIDIAPTYYGNNNAYFEPAFMELDAHAGYSLTPNVSLLATFRNMSGVYNAGYQYFRQTPALGASTVAGLPYPLFGVPYGPRAIVITLQAKY